jgi:endonuclease/exonuclease/phosphatase (EEP) superfamily protein YafD
MSSTALSHLPPASQTPLFFRLDVRSQRLVALTDVMQTPLHWLDEPRSAWPAQLPAALGISIDHVWTSPDLAVIQRRLGRPTGSDHRPVVTVLTRARP